MGLIHKIGLTLVKGVGLMTAKNLLSHFGTAEAIFEASMAKLLRVDGIGEKTAQAVVQGDALARAEEYLDFIDKHQITVLLHRAGLSQAFAK